MNSKNTKQPNNRRPPLSNPDRRQPPQSASTADHYTVDH
ncbi:hypothetical protein COLO4_24371 [Corchorus olitorius]|uniref:Uncharacterized protein n=1 Tax=Corchorus olitorius TaxID=93759 RepID=A0A1R3IAR2_9ROSI|nr:hypothetical protein COLO4_24371 [Corchorus olitorius]